MKVTEIFEVTEAEAKKLAEKKESKVDLVGWLEDQEEQINAGKFSKFWHQGVRKLISFYISETFESLHWPVWIINLSQISQPEFGLYQLQP